MVTSARIDGEETGGQGLGTSQAPGQRSSVPEGEARDQGKLAAHLVDPAAHVSGLGTHRDIK